MTLRFPSRFELRRLATAGAAVEAKAGNTANATAKKTTEWTVV
jgi:hypothetical protein